MAEKPGSSQDRLHITRESGIIQPGQSGPGLMCRRCRSPFPILANAEAMEGLTDPFEAPCPKCGDIGSYRKSEIRVLTAHRKQ